MKNTKYRNQSSEGILSVTNTVNKFTMNANLGAFYHNVFDDCVAVVRFLFKVFFDHENTILVFTYDPYNTNQYLDRNVMILRVVSDNHMGESCMTLLEIVNVSHFKLPLHCTEQFYSYAAHELGIQSARCFFASSADLVRCFKWFPHLTLICYRTII